MELTLDKIYLAKVVDNSRAQDKGRIKIRVQPLMRDISDNNLPEAYPLAIDKGGVVYHNVPAVGTEVRVICFDEHKQEFAYLPYKEDLEKQSYEGDTLNTDFQNSLQIRNDNFNIQVNKQTGKLSINVDDISIKVSDGTYISLKSLLGSLVNHVHIAPTGVTAPPITLDDQLPLSLEKT